MNQNGAIEAMNRTTGEVVEVQPKVYMGGVAADGPTGALRVGLEVANELTRIIREKNLYSNIQGKNYVTVEGWTTAAAMLGWTLREESVEEDKESGDFIATVALVRCSDGLLIGRASAICGKDEATWGKRPRYARRSMAVTRAAGKACRLSLSWIVKVAGFEPTPEEEMPGGGEKSAEPAAEKPAPKGKPKADQQPPAERDWKEGRDPAQVEEMDHIADKAWGVLRELDNGKWKIATLGDVHRHMRHICHQKVRDVTPDSYRWILDQLSKQLQKKPVTAGA